MRHAPNLRPGVQRLNALCVAVALLVGLLATVHATPALFAQAGTTIRVDDGVVDGLAAHWKLDEPAAGTAREIILGANGTLATGASMTFGPLPPVIFSNPAVLSLDGATGVVNISDNATLNAATSVTFTVALWVRRNAPDLNTASTLYDSGTQAGHWYVGFLSNNALAFTTNGLADFPSTHVVSDTNWHHVAFVKDATGAVTVYLDGVAAPALSVGAVNAPSGAKLIGNKQALNTPLAGYIDDLRIYSRPLSAGEVLRLAQGKGCVTNGDSWPTAMRELPCALAEATPGTQIWIGDGAYTPGLYRFAPFFLKNGVDLYGGFRGVSPGGNETALDQRPVFNPDAPLTTLSGDIAGNDLPSTFTNYGDNHIVVLLAPGGVTARVDSLRVQGGNADGVAGGLSNNGGGLRAAPGSAVTLNNVVFFANRAQLDGGGIFSQAPLQVTAASFISNTSVGGNGGGLAITATLALTNSNFLSNTAVGDGGGLFVTAPATVSGGTFRNNRATAFYGGAIAARDLLTVSQATFVANQAGFDGGAIAASATTLVDSAIFQSNRALTFYGGAIAASGPATIQFSTFLSNTAAFGGGAVSAAAGLRINASEARYNRVLGANCAPGCSHGSGGAIFASGPVTVTATTLSDNIARLAGGALASTADTTVQFSTIAGNQAGIPYDAANPGSGGGIHVLRSLVLESSALERNQAGLLGGGAYISGTFDLRTTAIVSNSAQIGGGLALTGTGELSATHVLTNAATIQGGGLTSSGFLTITNATFVSNSVTAGDGGGLLAAGTLVLAGSSFERNAAGGDGGAVAVQPGRLSATGNLFSVNSAGRFGGAIVAGGDSTGDRFIGNQAGSEGGALMATAPITVSQAIFDANRGNLSGAVAGDGPADRSQTLTIVNSLFARNQRTVSSGAADVRIFDLTATFANNTFADPTSGSTPAIQIFRSTVTAANNIFANYGSSITENSVGGVSLVQVLHNLFFNASLGTTITPGSGNLNADPLFVNSASADYRVQFNSPAVDSGLDGGLAAAFMQDVAGGPRRVDIIALLGAVVGGVPQVIDMGAHEFQNQLPIANAGGPYTGVEGTPVALDGSNTVDDRSIVTYAWDCTNDGVFEAIVQAPTGVTCTYPDNGSYTVHLHVTDAGGLSQDAATSVTIANAAPVVTAPANQPARVAEARVFDLGSFVDPGVDAPWQVTVDWGDGSPSGQFNLPAQGQLSAQAHTYSASGLYTVSVAVVDKDGGAGSVTFSVTVAADGAALFLPLVQR